MKGGNNGREIGEDANSSPEWQDEMRNLVARLLAMRAMNLAKAQELRDQVADPAQLVHANLVLSMRALEIIDQLNELIDGGDFGGGQLPAPFSYRAGQDLTIVDDKSTARCLMYCNVRTRR